MVGWCVVGWREEAGGGGRTEGGQAMKTRTHTEAVVGKKDPKTDAEKVWTIGAKKLPKLC